MDNLISEISKYIDILSSGFIIEIKNNNKYFEKVIGNKSVIPYEEKTSFSTLYDAASLTKLFTSVLIYIAYEEKRISLEDFIYDLDNNFIYLKEIKVIDLLSHNQNIWTNGYLGDVKTRKEFYDVLYSSFVKELNPVYQDVHYIILSTLLEKIYDMPFIDVCNDKIIKRLNLKNTTFMPNKNCCASCNYEYINDMCINNNYVGIVHDKKAKKAMEFGIITGHASLFINGKDLLRFLETFLDYTLLKPETIKLMLSHRDTNYSNYLRLRKVIKGRNVNNMYRKVLNINSDFYIEKTYNNMGTRYRNDILLLNDIPLNASDNTITFSGYTGPCFVIDFDKKIIIVLMCNVTHNTKISRSERKSKLTKLMNIIYDYSETL